MAYLSMQVDVDRLMSELEKREAELRAHELGDGGMAQRVRGVEERNERLVLKTLTFVPY